MKLFSKDKLPSNEAIRYAEEQTKVYKQQVIKATNDYIKLQSNWNSLREWLEEQHRWEEYDRVEQDMMDEVLDKMNELEGVDNENNRLS